MTSNQIFKLAHQEVSSLVKTFSKNESAYLSNEYKEADVRQDFIDKFFSFLGWDVKHDKQKNPYKQEVKIEKGVTIGLAQKKADYAFYITPNFRDPRFYVEAKKPSLDIYNKDYYFQTVRYGWNSRWPQLAG